MPCPNLNPQVPECVDRTTDLQLILLAMRRILSFLARLPQLLLVGLVRAYQLLLSPNLGNTCRFHPTCSEYAIQAFRQYGAVRGLILTVYRLGRCHPWGGHGYDPPRWFGEPAPEERSTISNGVPEQ
jgi:putative membrane protein insertion efficiency factor